MKRKNLSLCVLIITLLFCGVSFGAEKKDAPALDLQSFRFSYTTGYYMNSGCSYSLERGSDGAVTLQVRLDGMSEEEAPVLPAEEDFARQLSEVLERYDVASWNGFQGNDPDVLDGDSFYIDYTTTEGGHISANGYMSWPDHYGEVRAALDTLFVSCYDTFYPNHFDLLEEYYQSHILPGQTELDTVEIRYPYVSAGNDMFIYGEPEVPEGILSHTFGNFTGGPFWDYNRDHSDMMVLYLYKEPSEGREDYHQIWIRFEIYSLDDDQNVQLLGEDWVESNACWNDGIYAYLFTHEQEGQTYLGYFSQKFNRAGGYTSLFTLYLYRLGEDGPELLEAEELEGSLNRDTWSWADLEPFVTIAENYGFHHSLKYWQEHPFDPVIMDLDINRLLSLHTSSNYKSGFLDALTATAEGDAVEGFQISGGISIP